MINLTDHQILNYLMTSDFNEGLTNTEAKFLLKKYKNFYRKLNAQLEYCNNNIESINKKNELVIKELNDNLDILNKKISDLISELEFEQTRKITWKERIFGKKIKK